jgi:hypothetical protein
MPQFQNLFRNSNICVHYFTLKFSSHLKIKLNKMQMCQKIPENWHGLVILSHKIEIKISQHFEKFIVYIVHK